MPSNQYTTTTKAITAREAPSVLAAIDLILEIHRKSANIAAAHGFLKYDIERLKAVKNRLETTDK